MGEPQAAIVSQWNGIDARGNDLRTTRKSLDHPRDMRNFALDDNGHLFMPPASELIHSFPSGDESIIQMQYVEDPRGIIIQMESGKVYHFNLPTTGNWDISDFDLTTLVSSLDRPEALIWTISSLSKGIFGNAARGTSTGGQTFEVEDDSGVSATEITDLPRDGQASFSVLWKGRRFVVVRGRQVWYSELNEHQDFPDDNTFRIGGDDGGNDWITNPGFVQGIATWEDTLLFFMNSSVWMLTGGSDPDTWQLRNTLADMGSDGGGWTLVPSQYGVFTFGGGNQGDRGVYNFQGSQAQKVSDPVFQLMGGSLRARNSYGSYILHTGRNSENQIQVLLYNFRNQRWVAYDGYRNSVSVPTPHGYFISDELDLYFVPSGSSTPSEFPRKPNRDATVTLGWEDEGHPNGLVRYLGVKISGKKSGGEPTVQVAATIPAGITFTSTAVKLTTDTFDGLLLPLRFRGPGIELELTITPDTDDDEVLIESLELIHSRKGEKVSRH